MTGQAIGEILALGVGVALSPLAIVAVVVMLVAPRGTAPASAFVVAWAASLALVAGVVLFVADEADASDGGEPATWVSVLKIAVGALLVVFGSRQWRRRAPREGESDPPGWLRRLDGISAPKAAGLAALFNVAKPKNLLLAVAAGLSIAQVAPGSRGGGVAVAAFALLGSVGIAAPLVIHVAMPRRGRDVLVDLRDWMVRENTAIIAVLSLVIAAKLVGDAVAALAS